MMSILALLVSLSALVPSNHTAHAGGGGTQIRVVELTCILKQAGIRYRETSCYISGSRQIMKIQGINQNNTTSVWNAGWFRCEADGNNVWFVRDWWWKFERGVTITLTGNRNYVVQTNAAAGRAWLNVGIKHNYLMSAWGTTTFIGDSITYYATDK